MQNRKPYSGERRINRRNFQHGNKPILFAIPICPPIGAFRFGMPIQIENIYHAIPHNPSPKHLHNGNGFNKCGRAFGGKFHRLLYFILK